MSILDGIFPENEIPEAEKAITNKQFRQYVRRLLDNDRYMYKNGDRLSTSGFLESAFADGARQKAKERTATATADYLDGQARLRASAKGSGYAEYALERAKSAYDTEVAEAARIMAEAYPDYYEDLPMSMQSTPERRLKVLSFILSNNMTEDEALLYALAADMSYSEALELTTSAKRISGLVSNRFEYFNKFID